jgi:hypothetical protein
MVAFAVWAKLLSLSFACLSLQESCGRAAAIFKAVNAAAIPAACAETISAVDERIGGRMWLRVKPRHDMMSSIDTTRTSEDRQENSASAEGADIALCAGHIRFVLIRDIALLDHVVGNREQI